MKKKFSIFNFQFSIKLFLLFFTYYILHTTYYIPIATAVDSTPSADIKAKLEELKKEIASKAAQFKKEVDRKLRDKAYTGKVKSVSDTTLTLAADSGPKVVSLNQDTVYDSDIKSRQKFSKKNISEEVYLAALGDADETGVLTAKKIILLPAANSKQPKAFLWGQIISISDKVITLKNKDMKNVAVTLFSGTKVKVNEFVILTGNYDKNDIFEAEFVYAIPQGGFIKPKKIATPSASKKTN